MKNHHKGFFSYTRKERTGIIVLVCLIIATILVPSFLPTPTMEVDNATFEHLRTQLASLEQKPAEADDMNMPVSDPDSDHIGHEEPRDASLFTFDPNTLTAAGWERLGVRARTAQTIRNYVLHGGKFRKPEDLYKIYGLRKEEADRLIPYVSLPESDQSYTRGSEDRGTSATPDGTHAATAGGIGGSPGNQSASGDKVVGKWRRQFTSAIIDINTADTSAFIALWGIGNRLASRIVNFREKLGGFHRVDQVGETYGLPDSTFQAIKSHLTCTNPALRTININTADAVLLDQHPYISRSEAHAIVRYREQHGAYQAVDQLLQIAILTPDHVEKIRPYLTIQ